MNNQSAPLTLARLIELNACAPQVKLFKATFGESVDLANPPEGYETLNFEWEWAARNLLDGVALAEYDKATALEEYEKAVAPALVAYDKAIATARAAYDKATTGAEYDKAAAAAFAAWEKYDKVIATAFVAGYVATYRRQQGDN